MMLFSPARTPRCHAGRHIQVWRQICLAAALMLGSTFAGAATSTCNPAYLAAKAQQHEQKAYDYEGAAHNEALKQNPSRKKLAYYDRQIRNHRKMAEIYRTETGQCEANRPWHCKAKCNVDDPGKSNNCPKRVFGDGNGKTRPAACKAAQKDANDKVPKGCYKRHCNCNCSR